MSVSDKLRAQAAAVSSREARHQLLSNHPVLGLLTAEDLDGILRLSVTQHYPAGQAIFLKDDPGESLMVIAEGSVKISVSGPEGKEAVLAVLGQGEILGEMAILENKPRSADAIALAPCEMLVVRRRDFLPFLEHNPRLAIRLLAVLSERLRRTSALVEERMLHIFPQRLAKAILQLCEATGCEPGSRVELPFRQKVFASLLGTSRETLNKQLHAWQSEGLITLRRRSMVIELPQELARIARPSVAHQE